MLFSDPHNLLVGTFEKISNPKAKPAAAVLAVLFIAASCAKSQPPAQNAAPQNSDTQQQEQAGTGLVSLSEENLTPSATPASPAGTANSQGGKKDGAYRAYTASAFRDEQRDGQKIVLFFHSPTCAACVRADNEFVGNASKIPAGITVMRVNFESEEQLKKRYGVTASHTFLEIDLSGKVLTRWDGGGFETMLKNIR